MRVLISSALWVFSPNYIRGAPWAAPNPCVFTYGNRTWDLTPLYNGGAGYLFTDNPPLTFRYRFEVCGDVDPIPPPPCANPSSGCTIAEPPSETYCNPSYLPYGFANRGAILQFIDDAPDPTCDVAPNATLCTSGNCVLLADGAKAPNVRPLDPPRIGVTWTITAPTYAGPFACPNNEPRTVRMEVLCDDAGLLSAGAVVSNVTEDPECTYTISFPHKRGCGEGPTTTSTPSPTRTGTPSPTASRTPRPSCRPRAPPDRDHCRW
jgi:hypothetical protein